MTSSAKPEIDAVGARRFLTQRFGDDLGTVELAGEGEWSRCFSFTHDSRELVVRFGRHLDDFEKDRLAGRWSRPGLSVPAVLDIGPADDGWFAVSERVHGEALDQLDADSWRAALPAVLRALDALAHLAERGTDLADAAERITACQLHGALAAMPYSTSVGRVDDAAAIAARIAPLLDGALNLDRV